MKTLLISALLFVSAAAHADSRGQLNDLFARHFMKHYESGRCGANVLNFLKTAKTMGKNTDELYLMTIKNKGFSAFGMVNAERARSDRTGRDDEKNWYHHVVVIDKSGFIYDFDYTANPEIAHVTDYIDSMFLEEPECERPSGTRMCVGRKDKLEEYEISMIAADDVLKSIADPKTKTAKLKDLYSGWSALVR